MPIRDRIKELRRVPARELRPNPKNWRTHGPAQQEALRGVLAEIGYAGALLARQLDDGALELVDGHLRAETTPDAIVPVLVLDLTAAEADKLLATFDPIATMAGADAAAMQRLIAGIEIENPALRTMADEWSQKQWSVDSGQWSEPDKSPSPSDGLPDDHRPLATDHCPWQIGLVVGPSGSGKTTLARRLFGDNFIERVQWPHDRAVIDCFEQWSVASGQWSEEKRSVDSGQWSERDNNPPRSDGNQLTTDHRPLTTTTIHDITGLLTAVGFSSPPSWIKPYHVLSGGERFRCDLARALSQWSVDSGQWTEPGSSPSRSDGNSLTTDHRPLTTPLVAFDEFTSVVDRNVARIGSAAVAKGIRSGKIRRRFVAVTCHYDIIEWLCPDWIIDMATRSFEWMEEAGSKQQAAGSCSPSDVACHSTIAADNGPRVTDSAARSSLPAACCELPASPRRRLRRPEIRIEIYRCHHSVWEMFKRHHYLSGGLSRAARCFVAVWNQQWSVDSGQWSESGSGSSRSDGHLLTTDNRPLTTAVPVAFCATLPVIGRKNHWRISRIVTLPDFQGIGIGMRVVEAIADLHRAEGHRLNVTASHPSLIAHCRRSAKWRAVNVLKTGSRPQRRLRYAGSAGRAVVSFEYIGSVTQTHGPGKTQSAPAAQTTP